MPNFYLPAICLAAFVPLLFGAFWYSNSVFSAITGENPGSKKHKPIVYILTIILSFPIGMFIAALMSTHAPEEMNAGHIAFHGSMMTIFVILPAFLIHFMFEGDRSIRNMIYHLLYWIISAGIMGAIIGAWH